MTDRLIAQIALIISVVSVCIAFGTFLIDRKQLNLEYAEEVFVHIQGWPFKKINRTPYQEVPIEITNTSKTNLEYYLRVNGNAVCVQENDDYRFLEGCAFESKISSLSKSQGKRDKRIHNLKIYVSKNSIKMHPLSYSSDPDYYINIEVLSAKNGKKLFSSKCYYSFIPKTDTLHFYEPEIDTSGRDKILHSYCYGSSNG